MFRLSLSGKVAFAQLAQMIVFSASIFFILWTTARLFDETAVISEKFEPTVEELGRVESQLATVTDFLESGTRDDARRAEYVLHRNRPLRQLKTTTESLADLAAAPELGREVRMKVQRALAFLTAGVTVDGRGARDAEAAINAARSRLTSSFGDPQATQAAALELKQLVQPVRLAVGRAAREGTSARREADHDMMARRSRLWTSILVVSIVALVLAVVFLVAAIRSMRPVGEITLAVRRLAGGDLSKVRIRASREIEETAEAINQLATTLSAQRAAEAVEKEREVRTERLAVVGRMASAVAHEIRNPLNSISLNVDVLADMVEAPQNYGNRAREVIRAVQREVDRLNEITEDYLQFGRMPKAMIGPCNVTLVVTETRDFMAREFEESGVNVTVDSFDETACVLSDEGQLRQALVNILRNAVEAMPGGGRVDISVRAPRGDKVALSIRDTGPGISKAQMGRLFEPFATTKPGGTGLGLAFVQQVVNESGGTVNVESGEGAGTTVNIVLNRVQNNPPRNT